MKAYKAEVLVIAFEGEDEAAVRHHLGTMRYMHADVKSVEVAEIGDWSDDHPLNQYDTQEAEYRRLFSSSEEASPSCTGMTARWCPVHGDCICAETNAAGDWQPVAGCPLHDDVSGHPTSGDDRG